MYWGSCEHGDELYGKDHMVHDGYQQHISVNKIFIIEKLTFRTEANQNVMHTTECEIKNFSFRAVLSKISA